MMKKALLLCCVLVLSLILCTTALAEDWACPNCGRINSGNFCPHDATAKPAPIADVWTCSKCGSTGLTGNFCSHCGQPKTDKNANGTESNDILFFKGHIEKNQVQKFTFTAVRNGRCVLQLTDIYGNNEIAASVTDSRGHNILNKNFWFNAVDLSSAELVEGEKYTITLNYYYDQPTDYAFTLYQSRPVKAMGNSVSDSIFYAYQTNYYSYTAQSTGTYVITLSDYDKDFWAKLTITDPRGHDIINKRIGKNYAFDGYYEVEMTAGTSYIVAMDWGPMGDYTLTIEEKPKPAATTSDIGKTSNPLLGTWYCAATDQTFVFTEDTVKYNQTVKNNGKNENMDYTSGYSFYNKGGNCNLKIGSVPYYYDFQNGNLRLVCLAVEAPIMILSPVNH